MIKKAMAGIFIIGVLAGCAAESLELQNVSLQTQTAAEVASNDLGRTRMRFHLDPNLTREERLAEIANRRGISVEKLQENMRAQSRNFDRTNSEVRHFRFNLNEERLAEIAKRRGVPIEDLQIRLRERTQ